jgi:hypothetical protein
MFKDRVRFIEAPMPMSIGSNIRHFYVDDAYVFSIISFYSNIQTDGSTYMQNIKFIRTVI